MFYTAIEALTIGISSANAPYGTTYTSPAPPLFATPFITAANGQNVGQYFPGSACALEHQREPPDSSIDWSQFEPISGMPNYVTNNKIPYTEEYMLSIERGLGKEHRAQRQLRRHSVASPAGARGSQSRQPRAVPAAQQSGQPGARPDTLRSFQRKQCLRHRVGPDDQWDPRAAGVEFRKRHAGDHHRQLQLQLAASHLAAHQRTAAIAGGVYLQQVASINPPIWAKR